MTPPAAVTLVGSVLLSGVMAVALLDHWAAARLGHASGGATAPFRGAALRLLQQRVMTERPDRVAWSLAPAIYAALAAGGLAVVPFSESLVPADLQAGIVWWGSVEALAVVAIFLQGWSPNSALSLIAGYRYVALGVSYILVSMFVLIAAALPAESLRLADIVASQGELWNVARQPLGLPLFLVVALGVAFWGPLNFADSADLAGGAAAEASGRGLLAWRTARAAMLVAASAMAAAVFLGGWLGPWLPGWLWMSLKTLTLLAVLVAIGRSAGRLGTERFVTLAWTVLLPLAFLGLVVAGLEAL